MKFTFGDNIGLVRFFRRVKQTYVRQILVDAYSRSPFSSLLVQSYTQKSAGVVRSCAPCIMLVFVAGHIPQILYSVIGFVAVDVIYLANWPPIKCIEPRKAVCFIASIVNGYLQIPIAVKAACKLTARNVASWRYAPRKQPRIRGVMQNFAQIICRKGVHIVLLKRCAAVVRKMAVFRTSLYMEGMLA